MRLTTVQELEFLKLTIELNQGRFDYRSKNTDIEMLAATIAATNSNISFLTPRTSAPIPSFTSIEYSSIDWNPENENKDRIKPPRASKVYLVKGGSESARNEKISAIARDESFLMCGSYHNKDKSESAIVFSADHDTFNLMNFKAAKALAGEEQLSSDFRTRVFANANQYGVIDLDPKSRILSSHLSCRFM